MSQEISKPYRSTFKQVVFVTFFQVAFLILFLAIEYFSVSIFKISLIEVLGESMLWVILATGFYLFLTVYWTRKLLGRLEKQARKES